MTAQARFMPFMRQEGQLAKHYELILLNFPNVLDERFSLLAITVLHLHSVAFLLQFSNRYCAI